MSVFAFGIGISQRDRRGNPLDCLFPKPLLRPSAAIADSGASNSQRKIAKVLDRSIGNVRKLQKIKGQEANARNLLEFAAFAGRETFARGTLQTMSMLDAFLIGGFILLVILIIVRQKIKAG